MFVCFDAGFAFDLLEWFLSLFSLCAFVYLFLCFSGMIDDVHLSVYRDSSFHLKDQ